MGKIGFAYGQDADDDELDNSEEQKHEPKKKSHITKKKQQHHDNKLKQTRLIFTPKEESSVPMAGMKRTSPDSPNQFNPDETISD